MVRCKKRWKIIWIKKEIKNKKLNICRVKEGKNNNIYIFWTVGFPADFQLHLHTYIQKRINDRDTTRLPSIQSHPWWINWCVRVSVSTARLAGNARWPGGPEEGDRLQPVPHLPGQRQRGDGAAAHLHALRHLKSTPKCRFSDLSRFFLWDKCANVSNALHSLSHHGTLSVRVMWESNNLSDCKLKSEGRYTSW